MFIISGDPFKFSDVGKFCRRISDISTSDKFFYFNSDFYSKTLAAVNSSAYTYSSHNIVNLTNNRWLFSNFILFKAFQKKTSGLNFVIVHEPLIEYPAYLLSQFLQGKFGCLPSGLTKVTLQNFADEFLPGINRSQFINLEYVQRGRFLCSLLFDQADLVICHSSYSMKLCKNLCEQYSNLQPKFFQIPLAYDMPQEDDHFHETRKTIKNKERLTIGLFGMFFNSSKNIDILISTIQIISHSHDIYFWLAGHMDEGTQAKISNKLRGIGNITIDFHGFVSDKLLIHLLDETDFVWCFRHPTHGETSGTVLRALSCGAIPIVADHGWYSEIADHLVIKAPTDALTEELAYKMINSDLSQSNRKDRTIYIRDVHSPKKYGNKLASIAQSFLLESSTSSPSANNKAIELFPKAFCDSKFPYQYYSAEHKLNSFKSVISYFVSEHPKALELLQTYYENPIISVPANIVNAQHCLTSSTEIIYEVFKHEISQDNFSNKFSYSAFQSKLFISINKDDFNIVSAGTLINSLLETIVLDIFSLNLNEEAKDHLLIFACDLITVECFHVVQSIYLSFNSLPVKYKYCNDFIDYLCNCYPSILINQARPVDSDFLKNFRLHSLDFLSMWVSIRLPLC